MTRTPGPTQPIVNKDGTPTPAMIAFLRDVPAVDADTQRTLSSLIETLIQTGALPIGWRP